MSRHRFGEQLPLDFSVSASQRLRREQKRAELIAAERPSLFAAVPADVDVSLHSPADASATLGGDPDVSRRWLERIVGPTQQIKGRRVSFGVDHLDRLLAVRPPAKATLDAAAGAVARAMWAQALGYGPLVVFKQGIRLLAASPTGSARWPAGLAVKDVPWTAVAALAHIGVPLDVRDAGAAALLASKLGKVGETIARAGLAGSAIHLETDQPQVLEALGLPALAYAGLPGSGRYRVPVLAAEPLLSEPVIELTADAAAAIRRVSGRVKPLDVGDGFPWTLYSFQARDAAVAKRILETAGGVLLAGDMGSGKTTISLGLVHHLDLWPLLVVAPLAAFSTWARQLGEMGKNFYLASEPGAVAWPKIASAEHDAIVISYDRLHAYVELIETLDFKAIIADELQKTSSAGSRRSRALRQLAQAFPMRIGLSGTPMSNTLNDLLPLGSFLVPGEWKPRASSKDLADLYPGDPIESVAEHLGAMMVRRRMDEVGVKLPDKTVSRVFVQLTGEQRRALEDLQRESEQEVEAADGQVSRMHVFAKLMKMRQIVSCPSQAGVAGPNPKVTTAVDLAEEFWAMGRKSVLFCANRGTWRELGAACDAAGLKWVGIWGSSTVADRIEAERRYHKDPEVAVFIGTIQSCAEALTLSPTGTAWISCDYLYNPSTLSQAEARIYRLNTTEPVNVIYLHAQVPGGGLDDRMVEILEMKRALIAQVIDRREHVDTTKVHYSLGDLVWLLTGRRDERVDALEADKKAAVAREQEKKRQGKVGAHRRKYKNDVSVDLKDDGRHAVTIDDWKAANAPEADVDDLLDEEAVTDVVDADADVDGFDTDGE